MSYRYTSYRVITVQIFKAHAGAATDVKCKIRKTLPKFKSTKAFKINKAYSDVWAPPTYKYLGLK
jgi:hypothetical protein